MAGKKVIQRIPVNGKYMIEVDGQNWVVIRLGERGERAKTPGEGTEKAISYHHNLSQAIQAIVRDKQIRGDADMSSLPAYLAWHEATIHSLADRVLRQKELLKEAFALNGVM